MATTLSFTGLPRELPLTRLGRFRRVIADRIRMVAEFIDVETPIVFDRSVILSIDSSALSFDLSEADAISPAERYSPQIMDPSPFERRFSGGVVSSASGDLAIAPSRDGGFVIVECLPAREVAPQTNLRFGRDPGSARSG